MTDERFTFIEDCKDKKRIARGASHKRTHCGKGGAVMFSSDYLTTKEKKAMNGECKSYRMNDPMKWDEFKKMPEDLQIAYIKAIRNQFGNSNQAIFNMFGVCYETGNKHFKKLGLNLGKKASRSFDKEAWSRWVNGLPAAEEMPSEEEFMTEELKDYVKQDIQNTQDIAEAIEEMQVERTKKDSKVTIRGGQITLEGNLYHIMTRLIGIIGDVNVEMTVVWDLKED